jgi:hypothetical protein
MKLRYRGKKHVLLEPRGGCWYYITSSAREADRYYFTPDDCEPYLGFRLYRRSR